MLVAILVAVLGHMGTPLHAFACTRPPNFKPASLQVRVQESDLVFVGEVVSTTRAALPTATYKALIEIDQSFKGDLSGRVLVDNYGPSGLCYSEVSAGAVLIFFVDRRPDGELTAHYTHQIDATEAGSGVNIVRVLSVMGRAETLFVPALMRNH
jgi:hypothetical protein